MYTIIFICKQLLMLICCRLICGNKNGQICHIPEPGSVVEFTSYHKKYETNLIG